MSEMLTGGSVPQVPGGIAEGALMGSLPQNPPQEAPPSDPLQALQEVIEDFPALLVALRDSNDVHDATKALNILTGIQKRLMAPGPGQAA